MMESVNTGTSVVAATIAEREKEIFFPTYERFAIGRVLSASGPYIFTEDGGKYLDVIAGLGVNALGHSHPEVVKAVQEQAASFMHLSNLYLQDVQIELAEKLSALSGWSKVFFTNSGTEAVEGALKLARKYFGSPKKAELIGVSNCFHGRTYGALSVMDKEKYRNGFGPFLADADCLIPYSEENLTFRVSDKTAAVILEVIQGEGGIVEVPATFINALHELQQKFGFLIIADEIQSGVGRTGKFFAYEHYGLEPDIVVCAKAIGGGLPLGAILTNNRIASAFTPGVHGTTFGGNALACAAGLAVLRELEKGLLEDVITESAYLKSRLVSVQEKYPEVIKQIRGKGFMIGVELASPAKAIHSALLDRHVITNVTANTVLRLLPPLIFDHGNIGKFIQTFEEVLSLG
ncbi:MAG: acetylornithine transaminase [Bacteroidota bacterium]|nr:acetylornithine transaminase [Bacteroidota bacterium]